MIALLAALLLVQSHAVARPDLEGRLRDQGYSEQGIAHLMRSARRGEEGKSIIERLQGIGADLRAASTATPVDVERLAALLRERDTAIAEAMKLRTDHMIGVLRGLPAGDRALYLQRLVPHVIPGPEGVRIAPPPVTFKARPK